VQDGPVALRRTFRYRLYPTAQQRLALAAQLAFACDLYNAGLEQRQDAWRGQHRSIGYLRQCRDLTDIRAHGLGPPKMSCYAMREPLRRLDRAFAAFFRRVKTGEKPGLSAIPLPASLRHPDLGYMAVRAGSVALAGDRLPEAGLAPTVTTRC
jgi:Helix-turn-helix domain